jgi:hypothetical protein
MNVFTDSKVVALRDAVIRPSKRRSYWELLNLAKQNRTLRFNRSAIGRLLYALVGGDLQALRKSCAGGIASCAYSLERRGTE